MPFNFTDHLSEQQTRQKLASLMLGDPRNPPDPGTVRLLVQALHSANLPLGDQGTTALMVACFNGWGDIVTILLAENANPNLTDQDGSAALHYVITSRKIDEKAMLPIVRQLLSANANPNQGDDTIVTPLHTAALRGFPSVVKALLDAGANPNARTHQGNTPLNLDTALGAMESDPIILSLLLEAGGNPNIPDRHGRRLWDYLTETLRHKPHAQSMATLLLETGAELPRANRAYRHPETAQLIHGYRQQAEACWRAFCATTPPDITPLTVSDIIAFAQLGRQHDVFALPQWHDHPDHVVQLLSSLPLWLQQDILIHHPNLITSNTPDSCIVSPQLMTTSKGHSR